MSSSPPIAVVIGKQAMINWTSVELEADYLTPADAWSVQCANPTELQFGLLQTGQAVTVLVGRLVALRGVLDVREIRRTPSGGTLVRLGGRDMAAHLADNSTGLSRSWRNVTLEHVAQQAVEALGLAALGVTISAHADARALIDVVKAEGAETWWSLLDRYARKARLAVVMTAAGELRLTRPDYTAAPVAALIHRRRGETNVLEASYTDDLTGRCSEIVVVGQAAGDDAFSGDAVRLKGTASDDALTGRHIQRFAVLEVGELRSTRDAQRRAQWEIGMRAHRGETLTYVVRGHGPTDDTLWTPGQMVTVRDELAGIDGAWWLAGRRLLRDQAGGSRAVLTLRRSGTFLPGGDV